MEPSQASDLKALKNILAIVILLYALFLEAQCLFFWGKKINPIKIHCGQISSKERPIHVMGEGIQGKAGSTAREG